ncbi:MAG TPA: oligosaccharyl transferase, archaeosortase A system-associated [Methanocella sp.]|uniref:oligosaccharyl transferase, archaeosortase A system-associated n=1 Tax=Methanocella sp. TaxID=2052833 RepID=UPI002C1C444F|nr:oligosaccharyl transferase, archaeosortase A system-associated [Methanocella sp.]HTY91593.1 oligosaccharyl transferase, archaeosortase A system-associated [Methanocella sp.]
MGSKRKAPVDARKKQGESRKEETTRGKNIFQLNNTAVLLSAILLVGLALRLLPLTYCFSGGHINFSEFDPYYHMRRIVYAVEHFPFLNSFDSYVNYPYGYGISWPPLFDLAAAALSLIVGLGSPSRLIIETVSASLPVALGLISIVLTYYIVKDAMGRDAGLIAALFMAILPASIFRTAFAYTDHHALEVAMSLAMFLCFTRALASAREEKLSLNSLPKKPLAYALLAGACIAGMVFSWEGSPIFIGIIVLYALAQYAYDAFCHEDTGYLSTAGALASLVAAVIVTPFVIMSPTGPAFTISAVYISWFHVIYLLAIAMFFIAMGGLSRLYSGVKAPWFSAVLTAVAAAAVLAVAIRLALPQLFDSLSGGIMFLFGEGNVLATIVEVEPLFVNNGAFSVDIPWTYLSTGGILAIIGLAIFLLTRKWGSLKNSEVFLLVWTLVVLVLGILQKRFIYLLAVNVSIFAGFALFWTLDMVGFYRGTENNKKASGSREAWLTPPVVAVLIVMAVMAVPIIMSVYAVSGSPEPYTLDWNNACQWVKDNTPKTSYTYSADNGTHPEYGIMSWWDYGNYILYRAERPAVANNFQTGIDDAAHFFIAQDEASASAIMDKRNAKYVMLDFRLGSPWAGASYGVFENMPYLVGEDTGSYHASYVLPEPYGSQTMLDGSDKYYNTMYSRLYYNDGLGGKDPLGHDTFGLQHYRMIYTTSGTDPVKVFEYVKGATITGTAPPGAIVKARLNVTFEDGAHTYYAEAVTGVDGNYSLVVPYPTSATTGTTVTQSAYILTSGASSAEVQVPASAVDNGEAVAGGKL